MAKELQILFLYDTKMCQKEEDDPQDAVIYFHPSWVSGNQRTALCGQLIGVSQFLDNNFTFPRVIALKNGRFAVKKLGRYVLCVGSDRNIPDWILQKRIDTLYQVVRLFHHSFDNFISKADPCSVTEKLTNMLEMCLPVTLQSGNIVNNIPTLRLPKSASTIFLEVTQILECLQDREGIHGGVVLYQNKVVMSQMSTDLTKQLIITDPYRAKLPVEYVQTSFHVPVGVQLIIVYINEKEIDEVAMDVVPSLNFRRNLSHEPESGKRETFGYNVLKRTQSRICTVVEEESDCDSSPLSHSEMPDVVKDTMKPTNRKQVKNLPDVNISSYIIDDRAMGSKMTSASSDDLSVGVTSPVRYHSLRIRCSVGDESPLKKSSKTSYEGSSCSNNECRERAINMSFYNTISDPMFPWFRHNGLPVSKALHHNRIASYYDSIRNDNNKVATEQSENETVDSEITDQKREKEELVRPTSICLVNGKSINKRKAEIRQTLTLDLKPGKMATVIDQKAENDAVPMTPLIAKLKLLELEEKVTPLVTPSAPRHDTRKGTSESIEQIQHRYKKPKKKRQKAVSENDTELRRMAMYIFDQQNVSLYLLMDEETSKNPDVIHFLWKTCFSCVTELEKHFEECFERIPQTSSYSMTSDLYSYLNIHSEWGTLQKGGIWTGSQLDVLGAAHNDLNCFSNLTDIILRSEDSVLFGNQIGDNQVFYQQSAPSVSGLPVPSDLMGVVPLKARRRLERDHGILLL